MHIFWIWYLESVRDTLVWIDTGDLIKVIHKVIVFS